MGIQTLKTLIEIQINKEHKEVFKVLKRLEEDMKKLTIKVSDLDKLVCESFYVKKGNLNFVIP